MSWYRTGTINLTKDSASVTGVNTKWAQAVNGVMPGMMMILPDNKIYEIKNVVSDTSLVLVTAYPGATAAAQAYVVVTTYEGDLSQFSARFSALLTAMGGSRADMYNWLTSTAETIKIIKDDGTTVPVKTLKAFTDDQAKFATKNADGLIPIEQGGTNAKDAAGIRKNAGLGTAATKDLGTNNGNVMEVGAFGFGGTTWGLGNFTEAQVEDKFKTGATQAWRNQQEITKYSYRYAPNLLVKCSDSFWNMSVAHATGLVTITAGLSGSEPSTFKLLNLYSTLNTTKASDGTLKAASPVVKLFHDGGSETNDESEGCTVIRLDVGKYLIENCIGMNADAAWGGIDGGFDIPKDRNGQALIWLDFEVNADGSVLVQTYHRTYPDAPEFAQNNIEGVAAGEPVDIPADQFVSVRVEMPADSIWHQKQAAILAETQEE